MPFKNIIFDLDGTLIDSSDGVVEAVNYSLRMVGDSVQPPNKIKPYIGFPLSMMYPEFSEAPMEELYKHFQTKAAETVVRATVALDGATPVLEELQRRGLRMGIATTKVKAHVDGILEKLDWRQFFSAAVGGNEVEKVKPAPDVFIEAMKRLSALAVETLVVGDTINDVIAAKAIPVKVMSVRSPYGGHDGLMASSPDYMADSLSELLDLLEV